MKSALGIDGLRLQCRLGCTADERAIPKTVHFNVRIRFAEMPRGCQTDRLEDTLCYAEISGILKRVTESREFSLIESLAYDAFQALKKDLPIPQPLWLEVVKEKPPIPELRDGSRFSLGDWEPT